MHAVLDVIRTRISAMKFDTTKTLSREDIRELVDYATQAPSSTNIQHWRFVAVTKPEDRERLKKVAFGQQKVADAAVTFVVLGDLRGHEKLGDILDRSVAQGIIPQQLRDRWVHMANESYGDPQKARDEAIRSAALSAMTLMLAAQAKGYVSGPMIGFDPEGVKREFGIPDRYVPRNAAAGYGSPCAGSRGSCRSKSCDHQLRGAERGNLPA